MAAPLPITFLITDLHRGGSPLMLAALAAGLARKQFAPEVVSIAPLGEVAEILRGSGVPVASLEAAGKRDGRVLRRFLRHLGEPRDAVGREGGEGGRRIVMSILVHANILASLARPLVPQATGGKPPLWVQSLHTVQEKPRWHWVVQGMIVGGADAFVAPSSAVVQKLGRYGPLPARHKVIPNGIDVKKFEVAEPIPQAERPWPAGSRVVGYVGRFDPVKRIELLLEAAARLIAGDAAGRENLHVALVGYGPIEGNLRLRAAALGIGDRVHFTGQTREPGRWMKTFDVFCSPSAAEGFGLTLLEARAAGLPVVAPRTPAVEEALAGDGGIFWMAPSEKGSEGKSARDVAALAVAIGEAMKKREPLPPVPVENWSEERMVDRYAQWLQGLAEG